MNCLQSSEISADLQELARHVDDVKKKLGLPSGRPREWLNGMATPVTTSTRSTPSEVCPIYSLDYNRYLAISAKEFQDLFRAYPAIVVSGRPVRLKCDLASLEEWGSLDELRVMHGKSCVQQ